MFEIVLPPDHTEHSSKTKAVVVLCGWMGAAPKHVKKYADLYTERGCAVIYGTANMLSLIQKRGSRLEHIAYDIVEKACVIIRDVEMARSHAGDDDDSENNDEDHSDDLDRYIDASISNDDKILLPVILHYFSNAGGFVAEKLSLLVEEAKASLLASTMLTTTDATKATDEKNSNGAADSNTRTGTSVDPTMIKKLVFFSQHIYEKGFEISDSAPAYLHDDVIYRALETAFPNKVMQSIFRSLMYLAIKAHACIEKSNETSVSIQEEYWNNMIKSKLCLRQVFIYSTKDKITDWTKIDELIEERRENHGIEIFCIQKFEDSDHVLHLQKHPKEYIRVLDQVMEAI